MFLQLQLPWFLIFCSSFIHGSGNVSYSDSDIKFVGTVNGDGSVTMDFIVSAAAASDWIGLGISKAGDMSNSEIYMGTVSGGVGRYWADSYSTPSKQSDANFQDASVKVS